jgi:hypothetical protein
MRIAKMSPREEEHEEVGGIAKHWKESLNCNQAM